MYRVERDAVLYTGAILLTDFEQGILGGPECKTRPVAPKLDHLVYSPSNTDHQSLCFGALNICMLFLLFFLAVTVSFQHSLGSSAYCLCTQYDS